MHLARFCVLANDAVPVDSDGFLQDHEARGFAGAGQAAVVPLSEACFDSAVLLGEAGIGKSHALTTALDPSSSSARWEASGRVDLAEVSRFDDLVRKARSVLDRLGLPAPPANAVGIERSKPFLLVLDGVDECQANTKEIAGWFTDLAAQYDCSSLQVLIACRGMAYSDTLRQAVAQAFGITDTHTYTLAPLRRSDLITAAAARDLDGDRFLQAVIEADAQALARTPLTLQLLLDTYAANQALPYSRTALYAFALPHALMSQGEDRNPADLEGTQEQRFATAARLACYCLLTGAVGVSTRRQQAVGANLLSIDVFLGVEEGTPQGSFVIERPIIESVLNSALFASRGPEAAGPAHASIASYLAARYLVDHSLPREQLHALLLHQGEIGVPGIPGDLHELAAWLIALRPEHGPWLIGADPEAVASYSSYINDEHCREAMVDGLLQQIRQRSSRYGPWWNASSLNHAGLAAQLRRVLDDAARHPSQTSTDEAEFVLSLIATNNLIEPLGDVTVIALDETQPYVLRRHAIQVAEMLDREAAAAALKPLLAELERHPEHDPDDSLRGAVLQACRPWLGTAELLAALRPPQTSISLYTRFCRELPLTLNDDEIAPFLEWAAANHTPFSTHWSAWTSAEEMAQALADRALTGPSAEDHLPALAAWLRPYLRTYPRLAVPAPLRAPSDDGTDHAQARRLRRALVAQLIDIAVDPEDAYLLAERWEDPHRRRPHAPPGAGRNSATDGQQTDRSTLLDADDLAWLIELEEGLTDAKAAHVWPALRFVWSLASTTEAGQDTVWATRGSRVWNEAFASSFDAMPIRGETAEYYRNRAAKRRPGPREWEGFAEYVAATCDFLTRAETGDVVGFVSLCRNLLHNPDTGQFTSQLSANLLHAPGTDILPADHEHRLREAARRFAAESQPADDDWIGTPDIPWRPWAAVLAFTLLLDSDEALTAIPAEQWRAWAPTLLAFPPADTSSRHTVPRGRLLERALPHASQELTSTYLTLARASYEEERHFMELDLAESIWTPALESALVGLLTDLTEQAHQNAPDPATGPEGHSTLASLLSRLLKHAAPDTRRLVLDRIGEPLAASSPARDTRLDAAYLRVFLVETPTEMWPTAHQRLSSDREVVDSITAGILHTHSTAPWVAALSTEAVGELAAILVSSYPPASTATGPQSHSRGPECRDAVLDHLSSRGTAEAVHLLRELHRAWPDASIIQTLVHEAQRTYREHSWGRPSPTELRALVQDPRRRLIKDGTDLLDLVVALLKDIQHDLTQGTLPAAIFWNETELESLPDGKKSKQRLRFPKDENLISDYLAYHLRQRLAQSGILIDREVQINRNSKGAGDRIDLLLQAPAQSDPAHAPRLPEGTLAQAAIEVKGNWHRHLLTAMENQLADDYLPTLNTRHGLYLIAYFPNDQWTAPERTRPAAGQTPLVLEEICNTQAAELSRRRDLDIRALVLDCTARRPARRNM